MDYNIVKLDKRFAWSENFKWVIEFRRAASYSGWKTNTKSGVLAFDHARRWFNDNFGWSQDVETRIEIIKEQQLNKTESLLTEINEAWAYSIKYADYRIYVRSEKELNWFILSHPKTSNK